MDTIYGLLLHRAYRVSKMNQDLVLSQVLVKSRAFDSKVNDISNSDLRVMTPTFFEWWVFDNAKPDLSVYVKGERAKIQINGITVYFIEFHRKWLQSTRSHRSHVLSSWMICQPQWMPGASLVLPMSSAPQLFVLLGGRHIRKTWIKS